MQDKQSSKSSYWSYAIIWNACMWMLENRPQRCLNPSAAQVFKAKILSRLQLEQFISEISPSWEWNIAIADGSCGPQCREWPRQSCPWIVHGYMVSKVGIKTPRNLQENGCKEAKLKEVEGIEQYLRIEQYSLNAGYGKGS